MNISEQKIREYAGDPLAFFGDLMVPSSHGPVRFSRVMEDFQRRWFDDVAPSLLALARGQKPPLNRFFVLRSKGGVKR